MAFEGLTRKLWGAAFSAAVVLSPLSCSYAQVLFPDVPANALLIQAEDQFTQGHYALAAQTGRKFLDGVYADPVHPPAGQDIDKGRVLVALSCLKTDAPGCRDSATQAMAETSNPAYRQRLGFALAQSYFQKNELAKAIPLYEQTGTENLDADEAANVKFELAYCYFNNQQFDKAEPLFVAMKELKDSRYYMAGNYYYGLLVYNKNKYKEALQSFDRIKDAKEYRTVVPYYIAEIHYFMGNRDKALRLADTLIRRSEKSFYDKELHLLEAQCLFEEQRYKEALPYFEFYYSKADKIRKQDLYEIAFCNYKTREWKSAIEKFRLLSNATDSLGQTAMYLLGDCYLNTGDKAGARNAFGICADMNFNAGQQEAAMILFARISYEMGYDDDALRELNTLVAMFPGTAYKDEANTLISDLLVKTNKYAEALDHLKSVGKKAAGYKLIYQKATFGYAVQEFRKGDLASAMDYFNRSVEHPASTEYEMAACFWKAEIAYRQHHYNDVMTFARDFVSRKGDREAVARISPLATMQHALLDMGYASMALENYTAAQDYFSQAREEKGDKYSGMVAAVREADAVFMQKYYSKAMALYEKIVETDTADADYARYQKAILLGLQNKNAEKISLLQFIMTERPPSAYASHARYEIALTMLEADKYAQALVYLKPLADSLPDKSFAPQSWMKIGFIYQQTGDNAKAIDAYKHVVIEYPASEDRLSALDALRSLYIQSNQPAAYSKLLRENNLPSADSSSIDSTYYAAAEAQFSAGKWEGAVDGFDNYLREYPNGIFAVKARYYRAESNFQLKRYKAAREDYKVILKGPANDFFENSALRAAGMAYADTDYAMAAQYYRVLRNSASTDQTRLSAIAGMMKSGYWQGEYDATILYADTVLSFTTVSGELKNEALHMKARSLQHTGNMDGALEIYKQLSGNKNGEMAASSRYYISEIYFKQNKMKEAEAAANETIRLSAGYDYWIVKSYLLLSDILVIQKDYFNANATLQSVIKHTKIETLKQEAKKKLDDLNQLEKKHSKLSEE